MEGEGRREREGGVRVCVMCRMNEWIWRTREDGMIRAGYGCAPGLGG